MNLVYGPGRAGDVTRCETRRAGALGWAACFYYPFWIMEAHAIMIFIKCFNTNQQDNFAVPKCRQGFFFVLK